MSIPMSSAVAGSLYSPFYPKLHSAVPTRDYEANIGYKSGQVNDYIRGLSRNNSFFSATSLAFRKGVIGLGLNIQSNTGIKLGNGEAKLDFDREFERAIRKWGRKTGGVLKGRSNCEITGRFFFAEAQRAMSDEYASKSGGFIVVHHSSLAYKYGYKFEFIPISRVDTSKNSRAEKIINGIQIDKNGEITNIYIFKDESSYTSHPVAYNRMTLVVNKWVDPMQYSPVSPQASIIEALEYIDDYKAKEMSGASQRAENPIIVKTPYFNDLMKATAAEKATTTNISLKGTIPFEIVQYVHGLKRLDNQKKYQGGFTYISDDEEVTELGKAVDSIYTDMWSNESRSASAGVGLTASTTVGEMSSSYNEALRGVQSEEHLYQIYAQELYEGVFREMIEVHLLNGLMMKKLIKIEDYYENPDKYRDTSYLRTEKGHIDPIKTAKATSEDVLVNKTKTMKTALAEKGIDEDTYFAERRSFDDREFDYHMEMKKKYEEAGLVYPGSTQHESKITDSDLKEED